MRKPTTPSELGFSGHDRRRLTQALNKVTCSRLFRRIQSVLLVATGRGVTEASHITGLGRSAVYYLVTRYLSAHQVAALDDEPRGGRPAVAAAITEARILRELRRLPLRLGYRTNVWTVELLAQHLSARYECAITPYTRRRRMRDLGLRCKRPRDGYSEKPPHRAQKKGRLLGN